MDQHKKEEFKRSIGELYPRLHRAMNAYLAGTSVEAEDILQETFLKAYQNIGSFQEQSTLYTWLYSIARNLAIDEFRKRKYEKLQHSIPIEEFELASDNEMPDSSEEEVLLLRQAIARLPELLRSVVVMKTVDGMSYAEISEITGVNEQTLKNRMFRARKELAHSLKQMGVNEP